MGFNVVRGGGGEGRKEAAEKGRFVLGRWEGWRVKRDIARDKDGMSLFEEENETHGLSQAEADLDHCNPELTPWISRYQALEYPCKYIWRDQNLRFRCIWRIDKFHRKHLCRNQYIYECKSSCRGDVNLLNAQLMKYSPSVYKEHHIL